MYKIIIFLVCISILACKQEPTYNPFDNQFEVSISSLVRDECDTIPAGCGYFNLVQNEGSFRTYYQVFVHDWDEVVAKGFTFSIDTFEVGSNKYDKSFRDSLVNLPISFDVFNIELKKFGFTTLSRKDDYVTIVHDNGLDTLQVFISVYDDYKNQLVVNRQSVIRGVTYFVSNELEMLEFE